MLIIGAGETGARAAGELRDRGWTGNITLVGEEALAPYERPPLSKRALLEAGDPEPAFIQGRERLEALNIRFMKERRAIAIERDEHAVRLEDGTLLRYERLLLATGARPRRLPSERLASDGAGVLYLRSFADALTLRGRLRPGRRIAIVGGGFIGLEVAASARELGCEVAVIEAGPRILMRGVPEALAAVVDARHRAAGVSFKLGAGIGGMTREGGGFRVRLTDGEVLTCDAVVAGIGAMPATELAADAGLALDNGICTDERLATSDPDIFAAGDCCSFPHPLYDGKRLRLEAWRNAQDQGAHVAGSMLGAGEAYGSVPWFWSDQYDLTLQVAGLPDAGTTTVRRSLGEKGSLFFHLAGDGRLVAASGIGHPAVAKEIRLAEMLIERRAVPDPLALSNPELSLRSLLKNETRETPRL
ncbi:FAD-dependent oxidoreductase [Cohnella nanjingensis]|uniref:FAD-dependent oxidoreductase n=2 Tax=Cohnella nanjingensis TaxID=1387779 RepID=A0A7X0RNF7_9BACL|nr:FAD-dependent oxidoreductase [Cohnella nanjingensis]